MLLETIERVCGAEHSHQLRMPRFHAHADAVADMAGVTVEDMASSLPIGRIGEPEDQAAAVLYLCSAEARQLRLAITGSPRTR